jgi:hypothetical protein
MCDRSARRQCDSPSPPSSGPDHVHRIRHGLRIVCRRLCPRVPARARTHRNAPLSRPKGRGVYPNPWRPENVAQKGSFCVGLLPAPGGCGPLPPLPELPPLPSCPRCCPAAPLLELHDAPLLPRGTFGMECDGSLGSGPDQPDQHRTNRIGAIGGPVTRPTKVM